MLARLSRASLSSLPSTGISHKLVKGLGCVVVGLPSVAQTNSRQAVPGFSFDIVPECLSLLAITGTVPGRVPVQEQMNQSLDRLFCLESRDSLESQTSYTQVLATEKHNLGTGTGTGTGTGKYTRMMKTIYRYSGG
jgi:hypothetical protein